jgi:hypothetical protein
VIILSLASVGILFIRYRVKIGKELAEFVGSKASPYLGVFLSVVSIAFILETDYFLATVISEVLLVIGGILIVVFLINRIKKRETDPKLPLDVIASSSAKLLDTLFLQNIYCNKTAGHRQFYLRS